MYRPSASARRASSGPELKQWIRPGKAPFPCSSSRMSPVSAIGVARMHDQRQAGLARRGDMGAEALLLLVARAVLVVEIEAGLADADDLGMARRLDQAVGRALPLLLGLVRMDADRAPDVVVALGDGAHLLELVEPRADRQHARHAGRAGARQHARLVAGKLGEVEMAVAVDQHQDAAFAVSTKRGNTPCGVGSAVPGSELAVEGGERRSPRPARRADRASCAAESGMNGCTSRVTRADRLGQHPQHRVACRTGSVLAQRPRRLGVDIAVGVGDHLPDRRQRAVEGLVVEFAAHDAPAAPWRGRASAVSASVIAPLARHLAAAVLGDDRQHALAEIAVGVGEIAVHAADQRALLQKSPSLPNGTSRSRK